VVAHDGWAHWVITICQIKIFTGIDVNLHIGILVKDIKIKEGGSPMLRWEATITCRDIESPTGEQLRYIFLSSITFDVTNEDSDDD
jgi:hypothetical protein